MLDKNVYEVDLYSITENIRVNQDWSRYENILNANLQEVATIMVLPTRNPKYFREIVTGMLIPVLRETTKTTLFCYKDHYYTVPKTPAFIKIREVRFHEYYNNNLICASAENVRQYVEKHINNVDDFKMELSNIFETAEAYYENAKQKNDISDELIAKRLLKTIKK